MKMDDTARMSILYDVYGQLLTEKQSRIFMLYYDDNLSLSEIGEELNVSKQGVHDALKKAESSLEGLEKKLKLIEKSTKNEELIHEAKEIMTRLISDNRVSLNIKTEIKNAEKTIDELSL